MITKSTRTTAGRNGEIPLDSPTLETGFLNTLSAESLPAPTHRRVGSLVELFATRPLLPTFLLGLLAIAVAVAILFFVFRYFNAGSALRHSEAAALSTAQAVVEPLRVPLAGALAQSPAALDTALTATLDALVTKGTVIAVGIYDRAGHRVFPPDAAAMPSPPQALLATAGQASAASSYQDVIGRIGAADIPANQVKVWLPLRSDQNVVGVFEAGFDEHEEAADHSRLQWLVAGGALVVLLTLYVAFLVGMRQIGSNLARQREELRRSADLLPKMFRRSMHAEEASRQRIVAELEGRVANTLSTVKAELEDAAAALRRGEIGAGSRLDAAVPPLQNMISGVRDVAAALHRPGDDKLGMVDAIESIFAEARSRRPDIQANLRIEATDGDVPAALQPVMRRAAEAAFAGAIANGYLTRLRVLVGVEGNDVIFRLRDDATPADLDSPESPYARLHEHVLLSGGRIGSRANSWGGIVIRAAWRRG